MSDEEKVLEELEKGQATEGTHFIPVEDIVIDERVRKEEGDIGVLAVSIAKMGLLHPIIVDRRENEDGEEEIVLVAGKRRYEAHKRIGEDTIEAKFLEDANELTRREIELEENIIRKNFEWYEVVAGKKALHEIKRELYGAAVKGHESSGWGLKETAEALGEATSTTHQDIKLAEALEEHPELIKARNKSAALRKLKKIEEEAIVKEMAKRSKRKASVEDITHGDGIAWLRSLEADSVDMFFPDPPYGKDLQMKGSDGKPYKDDAFSVLDLLDQAIPEMYRVLAPNRVLLLWHDIRHYQALRDIAEEAGFLVCNQPIAWIKKGGGGALPNKSYYAMNIEYVLHCQKGRRALNKPGEPNYRIEKRVPPNQKVHPTQKPAKLLRYFIKQHTVAGEIVADPFAGSGSTLIAALECGRRAIGCEIDEDYFNQACVAIEDFRKRLRKKPGLSAEEAAKLPDDFKQLKPATPEWMKYWKQNPDKQEAMIAYAKSLQGEEEE